MKKLTKRLLSFLLVLCMVGAMFPILHTQAEAVQKSKILTDEDYASADTVFAQIQAMKETPAKRMQAKLPLQTRQKRSCVPPKAMWKALWRETAIISHGGQ